MKRILIAVAVLAGTASAAQATAIAWNYSIDLSFADPNYAPISGSGSGFTQSDIHDLSWGSAWARSALAIRSNGGAFDDAGGPATGTVQSDGDLVAGNILFHNNRVIPMTSLALDTVSVKATLALTSLTGDAETLALDLPAFKVNFHETPNVGADACLSGIGNCADIFVIDLGVPFADGFFTFAFDHLDRSYFADLTAAGLARLTDRQCEAAGAALGCTGIVTDENQLNKAEFFFRIRSNSAQVSEPATVGLIGLGLLGLALRRRRAT